jgi:hypothetical protein
LLFEKGHSPAVNRRFLFVCGLLLMFARTTLANGNYQPTRDGRILVWNNRPEPGDEATWSGRRDAEGYARGFGTLIWYTKQPETGIDAPLLYARYWGNMVHGKFDGPVNVHSKRKTHHAVFIEGARATRWSAGTAPSLDGRLKAVRQRVLLAKQNAPAEPEAPVPAEGPLGMTPPIRNRVSGIRNQRAEINGSAAEVRAFSNEVLDIPAWPKIDVDESIQTLALPPRQLRWKKR